MKECYSMGFIIKRQFILILSTVITGISYGTLYSQDIQPKYSRQTAIESFSKNNYEQALREFNELLEVYSKDPLYKYYSGVCLVKLNRNPGKAAILLQEALKGAAVVKPVPSDGWFYLGRAQQMSGNFSEAIKSYRLYAGQSGKRVSDEFNVSEYIQQCNEKKGQIKEDEAKLAENFEKSITEVVPEDKGVTEKVIKQPVVKAETRKEPLPDDYDKILAEAIGLQVKADSLNAIISARKKDLERLPDADKAALKTKISETELLAASYQKMADQKYNQAQATIIGKPSQQPVAEQKIGVNTDSSVRKTETPAFVTNDTKQVPAPVARNTIELFSIFEISAKPAYTANEKITINPDLPDGLIYRIQIAVFRNPVSPTIFKGVTPVYGFKLTGTDNTYYYAGMFRRIADARKSLEAVKQSGFRDAFIVAVFNGKPVSTERAILLEKEWSNKPFVKVVKIQSETPADTAPPTLSFRVEVYRSSVPLKEDVVETYKKLAGNRGLDILSTGDYKIVYLIGKFITFESASEYTDLLIRNGYRDAKVVAWLGNKEIPVETARQLIEKLK